MTIEWNVVAIIASPLIALVLGAILDRALALMLVGLVALVYVAFSIFFR